MFLKNSNEFYLDKSVIGFSLFKLNKDDDIKNILLEKYELIQTQFDGVLFYLRKHFSTSQDVTEFLIKLINDEDILFHHLIALVFKHFPELPFDEKVYNRFNFKNHRHWLVNYFMIKWLYTNDKKELILIESDSSNYFIQRELNNYKFRVSDDPMVRNLFIAKLMEENDELLALQGLSLMFNDYRIFRRLELTGRQNSFIESIISNEPPDVILYKLKNHYNIENPETFFNRSIWSEDREYEELKSSFSIFTKIGSRDPSKSLLNLNIFNNLVFDKICERLQIPKPSGEYGVNLNAKVLQDILPQLSRYWIEINEKRNQRTDAHPYNKFGEIRIKITKDEFKDLFSKEMQTLTEICNYRNY